MNTGMNAMFTKEIKKRELANSLIPNSSIIIYSKWCYGSLENKSAALLTKLLIKYK